jgi:hypothetical protein
MIHKVENELKVCKIFLGIFFFCVFSSFSLKGELVSRPREACSLLGGRISSSDIRYETFLYVLEEMQKRDAKVIVETGTARNGASNCAGDGCSTVIFADWATRNGARVFSVDINADSLREAKKGLGRAAGCVNFIHSDSIPFLQTFGKPIDLLYLDSYDFDSNNPEPSQMHHLREIEAAYPFLTDRTIVMVDDCGLPYGGKGLLVLQYLQARGWTIVKSGYQVVLVKSTL